MTVSVGNTVTGLQTEDLITRVNNEIDRRGGGVHVLPGQATGKVSAVLYNTINAALQGAAIPYNTGVPNVAVKQLIQAQQINDLLAAINSAANVCLCNCNYCTCNCNYCTCDCNYCTCDCNYCTCDCNYCTCDCNYACTCNCNYSDSRLKENITFIGTEDDLNVYSWNYLWDKATTYIGVMAQELVATKYAKALSVDSNGYYMVDYSQLPVKMKTA
jgi:hypothetical protein